MKNPYDLLGIKKTATADEIKKAYRKLARTLHPDVNPDKNAADRFKAVTAAYDLLSDPDKRRRFDAGEIDAEGNPTPFGGGFGNAGGFNNTGGFGGTRYSTHQMNPEDLAAMFGGKFRMKGGFGGFDFSDLFGMGQSGFTHQHHTESEPPRGNDITYNLSVPFDLSVTGGETTVTLDNGKRLKVKIPAGITNESILRLKGQGNTGYGIAGDALIKIIVQKSPLYTREDNNLLVTVPITLKEAVLGAKITIPTPYGAVRMSIPPYSGSGKVLRLKGKGVKDKGDLLVTLNIALPEKPDTALNNFIKSWDEPYQNLRHF